MTTEVTKQILQWWGDVIAGFIPTVTDYSQNAAHNRISFRCEDITYEQLKKLSVLFSTKKIDVGNDGEWFGDGTAGPWAMVTIKGVLWPSS